MPQPKPEGVEAMMLFDDMGKESMGEYEEHYALCNSQPPTPTATVWVTREGEQIAVTAMSDLHLVNTIRYIRRCASNQLMTRAIRMSDAAEMAIGTEFDDFDATDDDYVASTCPTFPTMLAEAETRGLMEAVNA